MSVWQESVHLLGFGLRCTTPHNRARANQASAVDDLAPSRGSFVGSILFHRMNGISNVIAIFEWVV
jgi:hypothetical protein